ncbi:Rap1a/Tai family immunity protein [uncultured Shimia sp.]|uniref:Rap1a/Tai family immunity protein n=1 Tax=uncultured Shimia sp. TaxID=573152 RepID=UPI00261D0B1D|nr:Rap1a/Tai family immunity protein [uncultured Shimia sp.]
MRAFLTIAPLALAGAIAAAPAFADGHGGTPYLAGELMAPCQEADSDARNGEVPELECEQYMLGFVGALKAVDAKATMGICAPEVNTADEVRWAFIRWVYKDYSARRAMPADEAVLGTLKDEFPCN